MFAARKGKTVWQVRKNNFNGKNEYFLPFGKLGKFYLCFRSTTKENNSICKINGTDKSPKGSFIRNTVYVMNDCQVDIKRPDNNVRFYLESFVDNGMNFTILKDSGEYENVRFGSEDYEVLCDKVLEIFQRIK